jgi:hypothetical protein
VLELEETVEYSNEGPLPIADVIASLRALERIANNLVPRALSELADTNVLNVELLVEGFEDGSFKESFVCRVVFGDEKSYDRFIEKLHKGELRGAIKGAVDKWGSSMSPVQKATAVGVVLALLLSAGIYYAGQMAGTSEEGQALIRANDITIVNIGADVFGKSPEEIGRIISDVAGTQRKRLARDAVDAIAPAKREPGSSIQLGNGAAVTIPSDVITVSPSDLAQDPFESETIYRDVDLQIRAQDLDSASRGWAALIPGLIDRRVRLVLGEGIDVGDLAGRFSIRADVEVLYRMDGRTKSMRPQQITILEIIKDDDMPDAADD